MFLFWKGAVMGTRKGYVIGTETIVVMVGRRAYISDEINGERWRGMVSRSMVAGRLNAARRAGVAIRKEMP